MGKLFHISWVKRDQGITLLIQHHKIQELLVVTNLKTLKMKGCQFPLSIAVWA